MKSFREDFWNTLPAAQKLEAITIVWIVLVLLAGIILLAIL